MKIEVKDLKYTYSPDMPGATTALDGVSFSVDKPCIIGIIGHTGSGKSTLLQHLNGLIKPTSGEIYIDGECITGEKKNLVSIRRRIGLVFQYPEYQLFEETVLKDVCFGPKNYGFTPQECEEKALAALRLVGIDPDVKKDVSPFELSGGEKRRVAIAGVLAMEPSVLILDEPTAGLDPKGHQDILDMVEKVRRDRSLTILLVSHNMDDAARMADHVLVLDKGHLVMDGTPQQVFSRHKELHDIGLGAPSASELLWMLKEKGLNIRTDLFTQEEAAKEIAKALNR